MVADEAAPAPKIASHHLIGLNLYTGAIMLNEVIDAPGSKPANQLQRASLALDGTMSSSARRELGDCGSYHGLLVSAPENGSKPSTFIVANFPGDNQGGIWMGGAAPDIDSQGNIWVATGNAAYSSSSQPYDYGAGVLKLSPSLKLLDDFAPSNW